ncbi:hypothetical protein [Heyndrickxia acidiproducens]|uniref:hypothetical protein n=1 Tax=Heyndrickxia acidiproducens TaxID=1121084 RepID=UPI00036F8587|nr:hypothetical protein [Heyndrickxia acidiproducens]
MKVLEIFMQGKNPDPPLCEDAWIVTEHFAAVIDGATAKSTLAIDGKTTGRFIAEQMKDAVASIDQADLDAEAFVKVIEKYLLEQYEKFGVLGQMREDPNKIPAASMAVYSRQRREVWLFGDCQAYAGGRLTNEKPVDKLTGMARKYYIEYQLLQGKTEAELLEINCGHEEILPLLQMQQVFLNADIDSPFAYSTISGFGYQMKDAKIIPLPPNIQEVALASDGYPVLFKTLAETEHYLKEALAEDPLCYRRIISVKGMTKGLNSYDDRCYLRIEI